MTVRGALLLSLVCFCLSTESWSGQRVTLRFYDSVMVSGTKITCGDAAVIVADNRETANKLKQTVIGESAPPGYSRYLNPADIVKYKISPVWPSLDFILPASRRIRVFTDCVEKRITDFEKEIAGFIKKSTRWNEKDYTLEIHNPDHKFRLYPGPWSVSFDKLETFYPKGPLRLTMLIEQAHTTRVSVGCKINVETAVVTAKENVRRGEELGSHNCEIIKQDITGYRYFCYSDLNAISGKTASRSLSQGTIINDKNCESVPAIKKGDLVSIVLSEGAVSVSVDGRAREDGYVGDRIWVQNIGSNRLLRVEILTENKVGLIRKGEKNI
ncbi:MAG: flagellar basal body P-ring formation protein FlgA [Chitinivibrionales bacterium]|nr:flagellar basal body P-ring formation protein FlgA [Chitinivibrionales bacterium]